MADKLEIYRGALRLIGDARLSSLTEINKNRTALDEVWATAVNYMLEQGMWNFAIRASSILADTDLESDFGHKYVFIKPTDWVRTVNISTDGNFNSGYEDFLDERNYWYANVNTLYVRYVSNDVAYGWNVGAWRQSFAKALEAYMAFESGLPISNDKSNRNDMFNLFKGRLKDAKAKDAVDEKVSFRPQGRLVSARLRSGTRMNRE